MEKTFLDSGSASELELCSGVRASCRPLALGVFQPLRAEPRSHNSACRVGLNGRKSLILERLGERREEGAPHSMDELDRG